MEHGRLAISDFLRAARDRDRNRYSIQLNIGMRVLINIREKRGKAGARR